jgi:hypothetical protein
MKKFGKYAIIFGFENMIKYHYETPMGRHTINKIFLLPIYIIKFY